MKTTLSDNNSLTLNTANVYAETAVIQLLSDIFSGVAYLDVDTIQENVALACSGRAPEALRTISFECADFLLSNFGIIIIGLITNEEFRDIFVDATSIEIALDSKDSEFVKDIRKSMQTDSENPSSGNFVINLENHNDDIYKMVSTKIGDSFKKVEHYNDAVDMLINELSDRAMMDIGFCFSNFMYLYRAFANDPVFFEYVRKVIRSVKDDLNL